MSTLVAFAVVLASSGVAYAAGVTAATARMMPAMIAKGWTPPATPTKDENPFRRNRKDESVNETQIQRRDLPGKPAPAPQDTRSPSGRKLPW